MQKLNLPGTAPKTKAENSRARKGKSRQRLILSVSDVSRIMLKLEGGDNPHRGHVCSRGWTRACIASIVCGMVQPRKGMARLDRDLHRAGVYPPGGHKSLMRHCPRCNRRCPPNMGSRFCADCYFCKLTETPLGIAILEKMPGAIVAFAPHRRGDLPADGFKTYRSRAK